MLFDTVDPLPACASRAHKCRTLEQGEECSADLIKFKDRENSCSSGERSFWIIKPNLIFSRESAPMQPYPAHRQP